LIARLQQCKPQHHMQQHQNMAQHNKRQQHYTAAARPPLARRTGDLVTAGVRCWQKSSSCCWAPGRAPGKSSRSRGSAGCCPAVRMPCAHCSCVTTTCATCTGACTGGGGGCQGGSSGIQVILASCECCGCASARQCVCHGACFRDLT
jgi:hypothetical protein